MESSLNSNSSSDFSLYLEDKTDTLPSTSTDNHELSRFANVITDKMLEEEKALEKKSTSEEAKLKKKLLAEEKKQEEEQNYQRLHDLLSKSVFYAKFMGHKLDLKRKQALQEQKIKKVESIKKDRHKKKKSSVGTIDVYEKENITCTNSIKTTSPGTNSIALVTQPSLVSGATMRDYQLEGYEWIKQLFENGVNGILADEMGLGKTIQCIAFIAYLIEMGVCGPYFICGPLSTVPNWFAEFRRFTPDIPVMIYHGDKHERGILLKKIKKRVRVGDGDKSSFPVVITSYNIALNDVTKLRNIGFQLLVVDEAHRIKNFECQLVAALKKYKTKHRLLLTGTPLQNNLSELWSLLNFILPEIFDDLKVFHSWFDVPRIVQTGASDEIIAREQEKQIVSTIHEILAPFLLRRTKMDVELLLPPKKEIIVHAYLTSLQKEYYNAVLKKSIEDLLHHENTKQDLILEVNGKRKKLRTSFFGCETDVENLPKKFQSISTSDESWDVSQINVNVRNITMLLRKVCGHPYLLSYPLDGYDEYLVDENIVKSSGKLLLLDRLLPELKKRGHKVLIFSQFVTMLEILEDYCTYRGYKYVNLYGRFGLDVRQKHINTFNQDDVTFVFLISTKAGGLGINLTAADTVIIYDSDWNPQGDLQAQDRCHRIGQTKPVVVYRFLIPNTVDEKILSYANAKRKLEKVIIQKGRYTSIDSVNKQWKITYEEMLDLLESCDVNSLAKADEKSVISDEELERILDRTT